MSSKLTTLSEAVASIPDGAHIALSGFAITRCTIAFAHELIRQGKGDLTISQCVGAMDADLLAGAGVIRRIIYGGGSLDRFGRLNCVNRGIERGTLIAEEYSSLSVTFRYLAGALGLPFIPIRSLRGSDLIRRLSETAPDEFAYVKDPFTDEEWLVLKPLHPDVAVRPLPNFAYQAPVNTRGKWPKSRLWGDLGDVTGVVLFLAFVGIHWILEERQHRQQVFMPGFVRAKPSTMASGAAACSGPSPAGPSWSSSRSRSRSCSSSARAGAGSRTTR